MPRKLEGSYIQSGSITTAQLDTAVSNQISGPKITSLVYPGDDTAANTVGGQTIYILGSNFAANASVYINGNVAPSISYISASNLQITTPALSAATYPVYVINPETGATAIKIPGLLVSGDPSWVTAAGSLSASQDEASAWSYTVSANSDSAVTYALAGGSSLPTGISLAANGLISGTLSSPPGTATTYNFTVDATDAENQFASRAFSVTVSTGEGVLFANNVLLIHADATNNKNNHTFIDSSNNNLTITRTGATQGTFSPFSQTGWSNYLDGTGDYLTLSNSIALSGNFTIEGWFNLQSAQSNYRMLTGQSLSGGTYAGITSSGIEIQFGSSSPTTASCTFSFTTNIWYHIAIVRSGSTVSIYINGSAQSVTQSTQSGTFTTQYVGVGYSSSYPFYGYISNFRILSGTALYTSNFTPPTAALTAISNTSLLTCQSNRFIDNSSNNFSITRNGDTSIQPFSPFAPTAAYSAASVGGSVYIPSGTTGLSIASVPAIGSGNFTVEGWFWSTDDVVRSDFDSAWMLNAGNLNGVDSAQGAVRSTHIIFRSNGQNDISASVSIANRWSHIAWVRNGTTVTIYLNGVSVVTGTYSNSIAGGTAYISRPDSNQFRFNGYISGFRVVNSAVYTGAFTPPTSPPTNIANTSLLLNYTNAGIFDQTAKNVIETVGDAKISTAQYKYGNSSMLFDGTGDALKVISGGYPTLANFTKSGYAGTIEMWVYLSSMPGNRSHLVGFWLDSSGWTIDVTSAGDLFFASGGAGDTVSLSSKITSGSWIHLAFVNTGSIINIYRNGTNVGTKSNYSPGTPSTNLYVGIRSDGSLGLIGYIDDLRITQGYARYTANFTAPTSAFKDN